MTVSSPPRALEIQAKIIYPIHAREPWSSESALKYWHVLGDEISLAIDDLPGVYKTTVNGVVSKHAGLSMKTAKLRYHWVLKFSSYNLTLTEQDIRKALSAVEACFIEDIRLTQYSLADPRRPRKLLKGTPEPLCDCGINPFSWIFNDTPACEQVPCRYTGPSWDEQVAGWKRDDARDRQRRHRSQERNRLKSKK
jgi:hypothetical protein